MNYNILIWEDFSKLPFPPEVKNLIKDINPETCLWQSIGLPIPFAQYTVSNGKDIYLQESPDGKVTLKKEEFTGEFSIGYYFVNKNAKDDKDANNYFVSFAITAYKGEIKEIRVEKVMPQLSKEYEDSYAQFSSKLNKKITRYNSWWYKYLYLPYVSILKIIFYLLMGVLYILRFLLVTIFRILAPI